MQFDPSTTGQGGSQWVGGVLNRTEAAPPSSCMQATPHARALLPPHMVSQDTPSTVPLEAARSASPNDRIVVAPVTGYSQEHSQHLAPPDTVPPCHPQPRSLDLMFDQLEAPGQGDHFGGAAETSSTPAAPDAGLEGASFAIRPSRFSSVVFFRTAYLFGCFGRMEVLPCLPVAWRRVDGTRRFREDDSQPLRSGRRV